MRTLPILAQLLLLGPLAAQTVHHLKASAKTVVVGVYDGAIPPALRVHSGDIVEMETLGVSPPERWIRNGLPQDKIEPARIEVANANPGNAAHYLTGPIYIEGAEPGDVLEVQIRKIRMTFPYALNAMGAAGVLNDQFPDGGGRIIPLDFKRNVALFSSGIEIPLRPFFGSMGVAPPASIGKVPSPPPGIHAGNLDNRELVEGTKLFIPVHVRGALFQAGDGHAAQGDGEVDVTALETSLTGEFRFVVRKDMKLKWPRAETPSHWIVMGLHPDLNQAVRLAVEETVDFLAAEKGLSRADAYMLTSVSVHLRITELVDQTKGVHAMIPKEIFKK